MARGILVNISSSRKGQDYVYIKWVLKYYVEHKALLRHENKVNENKVLYCKALRFETIKKLFSFMSNLQTYYHFNLDFQKVDQYTGGK